MSSGSREGTKSRIQDVFPLVEGETHVDMVLVMTVEHGFGGQVRTLRTKYPGRPSVLKSLVIGMAAALFTSEQHLYLTLFFIFSLAVSALGLQNQQLICESESPDVSSAYRCCTTTNGINGSSSSSALSINQCATFAILRTNSYYSSLKNLSSYLGINRFVIAEANGFSTHTEFLPKDHPLLIPIDCKCSNGGLFESELTKTTIRGESFYSIAEALEGLTTCKAIREKNPSVPPWELADKLELHIPLRCACPSSNSSHPSLLLSYPVNPGDTISSLAILFNTTQEAIISANNISTFSHETSLVPLTSLLIPLNAKPILAPQEKPREPDLRYPATSIPAIRPHRKKAKMHRAKLYVTIIVVVVSACIAIVTALLVIHLRKRKQIITSKGVIDLELQQLSLSIRTTSDKKVSFEGSQQDALDGHTVDATTPRKVLVETYSMEELKRATEDFSSSNHIGGSVYHGRLSGNNLAIKRTQHGIISRIEFGLFHNAIHHHPNIMRLLGTCLIEGQDSFLVFEYAKNGSLKDWLHGGLAIKNQFIASCDCFLTWSQRLRICLDVAMGLQYMHHIMNPSYVHYNVKSRNIFLDEEFKAKIGNFGMAKCVKNDTENLAPEYVDQGVASPSTDMYAYGIVLWEVLCGQKALTKPSEVAQGKQFWISEKITSALQPDNADEMREWVDSALGENYPLDAALVLAKIASACVKVDPCLRPSSGEVVEKLSRMVEEHPVEGENILVSESSSKPLVKSAAASNM